MGKDRQLTDPPTWVCPQNLCDEGNEVAKTWRSKYGDICRRRVCNKCGFRWTSLERPRD